MTIIADAVLSEDGVYRYQLTRYWVRDPTWVRFVMLNPSIADWIFDDATIRRCIGLAKTFGYGGLVVHNLFALRATDPRELTGHPDPGGPDNARYLLGEADDTPATPITICAWGAHPLARRTGPAAVGLLAEHSELACLGLTANGSPAHPTDERADAALRPYPEETPS